MSISVEHEQNVRNCLDLLEEAQGLINRAASELCPVPGFAEEWGAMDDVYRAIKEHWYRVERRLSAMRNA